MPKNKEIIPWKCHSCGREFDTFSGKGFGKKKSKK